MISILIFLYINNFIIINVKMSIILFSLFLFSNEMDPSAPGYIKLQKTPWLYAILKSTEPYLEEYFNIAPILQNTLRDIGEKKL